MPNFRCLPIPTATADRFRQTGIDDNGNTIRRVEATDPRGAPCRHCLHFAQPGEIMLLGSYNLPKPLGIYWTPSPIFLHAAPCPAFEAENTIPPIIAQGTLVSVRAYDAAGQCLYDLGHVSPGAEIATPLNHAVQDPRTAFINVHTAKPGCLLSHIAKTP